jgi:predicted transcriptional regulator
MSKPRGILWLEEQTGQTLDMPETMPPAPKGRHVSIRVSDELYAHLEAAAASSSESVSQTARRLLAEGLIQRSDTETAIDDAIAALTKAKAHLPR